MSRSHNSSLITARPSYSLSQGGSAGPVVLNAIFSNRATSFSSTTAACLTGVGKDATWLRLLPVRILAHK